MAAGGCCLRSSKPSMAGWRASASTVTLPPDQAYGERDRALQQRVPAETFGGVDQIEAGMCFLARGDEDHRVESVIVTEVDEDNGFVVVDTNHPLAGMTLDFEVSVVSVHDTRRQREAGHPIPSWPAWATGLRCCRAGNGRVRAGRLATDQSGGGTGNA